MTADQIYRSLKSVFPSPAHTLLAQVRNGTGFSSGPRTADALCVSTYPSRGLWIAGIEIKTYLGDWKRELANPEKAEAIQKYCHFWYVAAPEGIVPKSELPETWGLIEVGEKKTKIAVKSPITEPKPIDMLMLCSILRNVSECSVPTSDVNDLVEEKAKKLEDHRNAELKNLRDNVAKFEKESGVKIVDEWRHADIGRAVKIVVESGILQRSDYLQSLRGQAACVVESVDKILKAIE